MRFPVRRYGRILVSLMFALVLFAVALPAQTTLLSNGGTAQSVSLSMTVPESLTLSATPASITFTYNASAGTGTASGPITVVSSAYIGGEYQALLDFAWVGSSTAALAGPSNIPSSSFFLQLGSATPVACTSTTNGISQIVANASCNNAASATSSFVGLMPVSAAGSYTMTQTVTPSLSGLSHTLLPGSYTGVLYFLAEVSS